jgi:hypothetical protein
MKRCIRCGNIKELNDFYVHPQMRDGHLNKCKECCKEVADIREKSLRSNNSEWCEKERIRSVEKYHRLGYRKKQFEENKLKPYKNHIYKGLFKKLSLTPDKNVHHWNYNLIEDIIILDKMFHRFVHRYLVLNKELLTFETIDEEILDSKEKHLDYIEKLKLIYNKNL